MFSSPFQSRCMPNAGRSHLYRQVSVETGAEGASSHELVMMLFDGFLESVAQARGALRGNDPIQTAIVKGHAIGRAVRIVEEGLRAGLNLKAGGRLARDLDDLYRYLTARLTAANLRNDDEALAECQRLVQPLRDAWVSVAPAT